MTLNNESYFTVGMILTVLSLYSFSIYTHFSDDSSMAFASANGRSSVEDQREVDKILEVMSIGEDDVFRPIEQSAVFVPGTSCQVADYNLSPDGALYNIPETCFFVDIRER